MPSPARRARKRDASLLSIAAWCFAALTVALLLAVPVAGAWGVQPVVIDGGSMEPTIKRGELVLVGRAPDRLAPGDLAVVGEGEMRYVHRVVEKQGEMLLLKGDGNAEPDPSSVPFRDVTGSVAWHIGGPLGLAASAAVSVEGKIALSCAGLALVGTALLLGHREPRLAQIAPPGPRGAGTEPADAAPAASPAPEPTAGAEPEREPGRRG